MKASIGAIIVGLASAGMAVAQISPAYNQIAPIMQPNSPPPLMPDSPPIVNRPLAGTQLPASGIPMPPLPTIPGIVTNTTANPFVAPDLNAPYESPLPVPVPRPIQAQLPPTQPAISGPNFWLSSDYMFWWIKRAPQPHPLVVTGPSTDDFPGALDQPNTKILYGGNGLGFNPFSGMRMDGGVWFGSDSRVGFEMGGYVLEQKANRFAASGGATGNPFLARPFTDALTGAQNVYFVAQNFANLDRSAFMTGGVEISSNSRLWSWDLNGLYNVYRDTDMAVNMIAGFTSVGLREKIHIGESLQNLVPGGGVSYLGVPVPPSIPVTTLDKFDTENTFYGGQLGARLHFQEDRFGLDFTGKAAIGVMQELVDVEGFTGLGAPNNKFLAVTPGGVYAVGPILGPHFQQQFGIVPQGNIDLIYNLTNYVTLKAGYTFVYLNSVARPGNQINPNVNPTFVPTDAQYGQLGSVLQPAFQFHTSSFWAQGANVGVEVRY